ncbi:MAG: hypothetical protein AAF417_23025, partial [Pseudomonadota bacterium]
MEPDVNDPYQLETVVLHRRAEAPPAGDLEIVLDTQLLDRDKLAPLPAGPATLTGLLVRAPQTPEALALSEMSDAASTMTGTICDIDRVDLADALGVPRDSSTEPSSPVLLSLFTWLVDALAEPTVEAAVAQYAEVLARIAEEQGIRGHGPMAALNLRYARALKRQLDEGDVGQGLLEQMLQWPILLEAYEAEPGNPHLLDALLNHVASSDPVIEPGTDAIAQIGQSFYRDLSEARQSSLPVDVVAKVGNSVFGAGQARLFARSVTARLKRVKEHCERLGEAAGKSSELEQVERSLSRLERRTHEWERIVRAQQRESRRHHALVARLYNKPADLLVDRIAQAAQASGANLGWNIPVLVEAGDGRLDHQTIEALVEPMSMLGWWLATERTDESTDDEPLQVHCSATSVRVEVSLAASAKRVGFEALLRKLQANSQSEAELRLVGLAAAGRFEQESTMMLANGFAHLRQAVRKLAGRASLQAGADGGVRFVVSAPAWLTATEGRLVPAGKGIIAIRESGVEAATTVDLAGYARDATPARVQYDGRTAQAVELLPAIGLKPDESIGKAGTAQAMIAQGPGGRTAVLASGVSEPLVLTMRALTDRFPSVPG